MQHLAVSCAIRRFFKSLGFKGLMKLEYSQQIFEKYSNIEFNENPASGSRVVPRGRTGGQT